MYIESRGRFWSAKRSYNELFVPLSKNSAGSQLPLTLQYDSRLSGSLRYWMNKLARCADHEIGELLTLVQERFHIFEPEFAICHHAIRRLLRPVGRDLQK